MNYSDSFRIGPNRHYNRHADESYYLDPPRLAPERTYYYVKRDGPITRPTSERRTDDEELPIPGPPNEAYIYDRGRSQVPGHGDNGRVPCDGKPSLRPSSRSRPPPTFAQHVDLQGTHRESFSSPRRPAAETSSSTTQRDDPLRPYYEPSPTRPVPGVHESHEASRLRRASSGRRPIPQGFVETSPRLSKAHGNDLAALAQRLFPQEQDDVRDKLLLCVYRNSKKAFLYCKVDLHGGGHRADHITKRDMTDRQLFENMRRKYNSELRGRVRQLFSFKVPSTVRLRKYGNDKLFLARQDDDLFSPIFMKIWRNPGDHLPSHSIEWVDWLQQAKKREPKFDLVIEIVENYVPERIVLFVGFGLLGIVVLAAAWLVEGGNPGNVTTVMGFVLGVVTIIIALTGIWDWFDGGQSKDFQEHAMIVLQDGEWMAGRKRLSYAIEEQLKGIESE